MKSFKIFAIAAGLLALAACTKEQEIYSVAKLDASKPAVASLSYDDASSSNTAAGFTWSADAAIAAGATSFTLEMTDNIDIQSVDNGTFFKVVEAPAVTYVMKGLTKGAYLYARVRANYPGFLFSNWTYLGSESNPLAVCVGTGTMDAKFGAPANLKASSTETSIKATWDSVPFAQYYVFEYKPASAGDWSVIGELTETTYEAEGLVGETNYDIRVKAVKGDKESEYTTGSVKTLEHFKFNPKMSRVNDLLEFFKTEAAQASSASEFTLENDIDLSGISISSAASFNGILDGKGHSIKGLALTAPMFAEISGTVKNLTLEGTAVPSAQVFGVLAANSTGTLSKVVNKVAVSYSVEAITSETLIAGLVGNASGSISECSNEGAVDVTASSGIVNLAVGGIAAKASASFENCSNSGSISVESPFASARKAGTIVAVTDYAPCVAGLVGYALEGFSMTGSSNSGAITYRNTTIDKTNGAVERILVAGVVAATNGSIFNSTNSGKIVIDTKTSDRAPRTGSGTSYIVCVGGIAGGDYYAGETQTGTTIDGCSNSGEIEFISDAANANSTVGGIVGWPGVEGAGSNSTSHKCSNTGKITVDGVSKVRVGGISGGSGHITDCDNDSEIVITSANNASVAAFICGFHTQNHVFTGNTAKGKMEVKCQIDGAGGLIGGQGNQKIESGTGCKANCTFVTTAETTNIGLVVGKISSGSNAVVLGTEADPIKIKGNVNGTELTASNFESYIGGNYPLANKTIYAAFGE